MRRRFGDVNAPIASNLSGSRIDEFALLRLTLRVSYGLGGSSIPPRTRAAARHRWGTTSPDHVKPEINTTHQMIHMVCRDQVIRPLTRINSARRDSSAPNVLPAPGGGLPMMRVVIEPSSRDFPWCRAL